MQSYLLYRRFGVQIVSNNDCKQLLTGAWSSFVSLETFRQHNKSRRSFYGKKNFISIKYGSIVM